jgi:hypothetical protein
VASLESHPVYPSIDPGSPSQSGAIEAGPRGLARRYLRAGSDFLVALVPNPDGLGNGYVFNELDHAIPGFTLTRAELGIAES